MNALSTLVFIALLHSGALTVFPPAFAASIHVHAATSNPTLLASYIPPDRGIPGRRQGGGTR